jgi:hypothetical protein
MKHSADSKSTIHNDAVDCLIEKLILNPLLAGKKRREKLADLIDRFKGEYGKFTSKSKQGRFSKDNIWIVASKPDTQQFPWHARYYFDITEVLGKLACLVLSKNLGIGMAERNWKQVKKVEEGDCAKTGAGVNKTSKQVLVYSQHQLMHGALRRTSLSAAGKLWDDNDFASMKMDEYCKDLEMQVDNFDKLVQLTRIIWLWHERCEVPKQQGGKGHQQLMACMEMKYVGLHLDEMVNDRKICRINLEEP